MEHKELISSNKKGSRKTTNRELLQQVFCLSLCVLLLVGCTAQVEPTVTPVPPTAAPTLTPTPKMASVITTSAGALIITNVYIPAKDMLGDEAAPGYKILLVWFDSADGNVKGDFYDASEGVYITGNDGSETKKSRGGIAFGEPYLEFSPPTTAQEFALHWPGNPPIELVLSD